MAINKFIYFGEVKFDLTADTVTADKLAYGITAHDKSGDLITGTNTYDSNTTDATVAVSEMISGKTAYARGAKLTGTMPVVEAFEKGLIEKDQFFTIPQGYHDGSSKVFINEAEQAKIIGNNIRKGVSILGVTGTMEEDSENPQILNPITPSTEIQTFTPSYGYTCFREVTVKAIPYTEAENSAGGITIIIG